MNRENRVKRCLSLAAVLVLGLLAGIALGVVLHDRLLRRDVARPTTVATTKQIWTCSMHPQVIRDEPGLCPICHMQLTPLNSAPPGVAADGGGGRKVKYWWDPMMNPPYIANKPGKSPMGMDLVPVYEEQTSAGASVKIDPVIVQNMGVRTARPTTGPITRDIRAVGYLDEAQPNVRDVNLRVSGWVEKLHADTVGMALAQGAPLFELYSPDVQVATEELIGARKSLDSLGPTADAAARKTSQSLLDAARLKLEQWGLDAAQVKRLAASDTPPRTVTFVSPIDGYLTQKMIAQGAAVKAGDTVLRVVDLSTVWLDAQVYAQDLAFVHTGQKVSSSIEGAAAGKRVEGEIVFVAPQVDPQTRTATVRVALPNMELTLRPGMFATANIHAQLARDALLIPREAVIDTGRRQVAFVATGEGRFEPREVNLGVDSSGGMVQVLQGIAPDETVVTSGQFLLDAESRMQEAIQKHLSERNATSAPPPPSAETRQSFPSAVTVRADPAVDSVFSEYLEIQKALGAAQQADTPVDPGQLAQAARSLADHARGHMKPQAEAIESSAKALSGRTLPEQRKFFKQLSASVIALADATPPSAKVAGQLFVAFCPMAPGDGARWLQPTRDIANPYFATSMKECGTIERSIGGGDNPRPATTQPANAHQDHDR
jgi:Cu(I)/Ag(I) efflux system membrane fusion protein/cobalt-zinc-cadmium efflux system membrane fusion protein